MATGAWILAKLRGYYQVLVNGIPYPEEPTLQFLGTGVTVADNASNGSTDITINNGSAQVTYTSAGTVPAIGGLTNVLLGSTTGSSAAWFSITPAFFSAGPAGTVLGNFLGSTGWASISNGLTMNATTGAITVVAANGTIVVSSSGIAVGSVPWSDIVATPTTLAGYGITVVPWTAVTGVTGITAAQLAPGGANTVLQGGASANLWTSNPSLTGVTSAASLALNAASASVITLGIGGATSLTIGSTYLLQGVGQWITATGTGHRYSATSAPSGQVWTFIGDGVSFPADVQVFSFPGGSRWPLGGAATAVGAGATFTVTLGYVYVDAAYDKQPKLSADITFDTSARSSSILVGVFSDKYHVAATYQLNAATQQIMTASYPMMPGTPPGKAQITSAAAVQINGLSSGALAVGSWYPVTVIVTNTSGVVADIQWWIECFAAWG